MFHRNVDGGTINKLYRGGLWHPRPTQRMCPVIYQHLWFVLTSHVWQEKMEVIWETSWSNSSFQLRKLDRVSDLPSKLALNLWQPWGWDPDPTATDELGKREDTNVGQGEDKKSTVQSRRCVALWVETIGSGVRFEWLWSLPTYLDKKLNFSDCKFLYRRSVVVK